MAQMLTRDAVGALSADLGEPGWLAERRLQAFDIFEKDGLEDVHFFTCPMVNQSWAQKGKDVQNPYYGKSMLTCGTPKK